MTDDSGVAGDSAIALEAGDMARALATTVIEAHTTGERAVSTSEIQERLAQADGAQFAVHLVVAFGTLVASAVGVAAAALVNADDWQTAIAGQGYHPEFHDRLTEVWSTICAKRIESESAY